MQSKGRGQGSHVTENRNHISSILLGLKGEFQREDFEFLRKKEVVVFFLSSVKP